MNKKFYQVEKEINGKKYVAQFSGISTALRAADSSHIGDSEVISAEKYGQYILSHIIVEPKELTADDFDSIDEYNAVIHWGRDVMQGKFRNEAKTTGSKEKSE